MRFFPHTEEEIRSMLAIIGVANIDALFASIPADVRRSTPLEVPPALDEIRLMQHLTDLSDKNSAHQTLSFLGAGIYAHHVPPVVDQLLLRGEFLTAYTPYQAEVAQGTLLGIFEFQTIVSEIMGLPLANASLYDGATATIEAALMAKRITKKSRVLVSAALHPEYIETIRTYLRGLGTEKDLEILSVDAKSGRTDLAAIEVALEKGDVAAVIVGQPNFYGVVENVADIAERAHKVGALLVTATPEPMALSLVASPGSQGADIAVGEGQPLGLTPNFGGPGVGLFACRDDREFLTNLPGRVVGETVDQAGKKSYVLTLSTREQHIRRERATSNICSNHSLCALAIAIRMSLLGQSGYVETGKHCLAKAEYLKAKIRGLDGFEIPFSGETFNEFTVRRRAGAVEPVLAFLQERGILAGVDLGKFDSANSDRFVLAVTERHSREDLDRFVSALAEF